jgi:hypothetical protein
MKVHSIPKNQWTDEMERENMRLQKRFRQLVKPWEKHCPRYLYHYTSSETLKKIMLSRTFRRYCVFDMNDDKEFLYPLRAIWESPQRYWGKLILEIPDLFNPGRPAGLEDALLPFATFFCEAKESKFMWQSG